MQDLISCTEADPACYLESPRIRPIGAPRWFCIEISINSWRLTSFSPAPVDDGPVSEKPYQRCPDGATPSGTRGIAAHQFFGVAAWVSAGSQTAHAELKPARSLEGTEYHRCDPWVAEHEYSCRRLIGRSLEIGGRVRWPERRPEKPCQVERTTSPQRRWISHRRLPLHLASLLSTMDRQGHLRRSGLQEQRVETRRRPTNAT